MEPGKRYLDSKRKGRTQQTPSPEQASQSGSTTPPMDEPRGEFLSPNWQSYVESSSNISPDTQEKATKQPTSETENNNPTSPNPSLKSDTKRSSSPSAESSERSFSEYSNSYTPPSPSEESLTSKGKGRPSTSSPPQTPPHRSSKDKDEYSIYDEPSCAFEPVDEDLPSPPKDFKAKDSPPGFSYPPPSDDGEDFEAPSSSNPFEFPHTPEPDIGFPPRHGSITAGTEYWADRMNTWIAYQNKAGVLDCKAFESWIHETMPSSSDRHTNYKNMCERREARKVKFEKILALCKLWHAEEAEIHAKEWSEKVKESERKGRDRTRQERNAEEANRRFEQKRREREQRKWESDTGFVTTSFMREQSLSDSPAIQAWHQSCEKFFSVNSTLPANNTFPKPPTLKTTCRKKICVRSERLSACCCTLRVLFKSKGMSSVDWKKERLRWHPDRFSKLGTDEEVVVCAKEMFQLFQGIVGGEK
ncbi:hypothetical protein BJ875DRAFT_483312 [Amylocarpus encephaloides]|uniref:Uncharacterized protein n=1 Tax=Amylocarpus encephaloides TaxID=45428 RepID=A0A9P8C645_9HELO|nr:hypothetical protein BJ875DRAFT_483312 [Amylocarpus encephaloides]